jgi:hypothetical protein
MSLLRRLLGGVEAGGAVDRHPQSQTSGSISSKDCSHRWRGCVCMDCDDVRDADHDWMFQDITHNSQQDLCWRCGKAREMQEWPESFARLCDVLLTYQSSRNAYSRREDFELRSELSESKGRVPKQSQCNR